MDAPRAPRAGPPPSRTVPSHSSGTCLGPHGARRRPRMRHPSRQRSATRHGAWGPEHARRRMKKLALR
eukprot:6425945-Lingulodinium_polyedra.AAC.1